MGRSKKKTKNNVRKRSSKESKDVINLKKSGDQIIVDKKQLMCRRYEKFHDNFLTYDEINEFLVKTKKSSCGKVELVEIGKSTQGRPIFMVIISSDSCITNSNEPKMGAFIQAGLNGENTVAVSNALYLIDYMAKNPNYVKIMDYYIVPCANPDSYNNFVLRENLKFNKPKSNLKKTPNCGNGTNKKETGISGSKSKASSGPKSEKNDEKKISPPPINLNLNFPVLLGINDMRNIETKDFLEKIKKWKETYLNSSPEVYSLLKTIHTYQFTIRLLISLQEGGETICYPYGFCSAIDRHTSDLSDVAKKGKSVICGRNFASGSIYDLHGLTYGSLIDFLKMDKFPGKYVYVMQVHKRCPRYNPRAGLRQLLKYGEQITNCIKIMSGCVYKFYTNMTGNKNIELNNIKFNKKFR
ncbi:uncharacterized protein LOC115883024 [Sitophilus oryzae]|uniref:Uncharacterized protein LOC115883024 n=1 Tax=Sitophilus oryzae TaxID=7048 RepID=A0A6J2Y0B6_SITOR|nr:uncharacterized protein LOC115883024 [Sitophilus oryzae]